MYVPKQTNEFQALERELSPALDQRRPGRVAATIFSLQIPRIRVGKARPPWSSVCCLASIHRLTPVQASRTRMPKDSLPSLPLSGLFAVAKPSGPTSMAIINDVKALINTSSLFVEQEKLAAHKEGKNEKPKRRKWKSNKDMAKIGQGGTLDPLAGESTKFPWFLFL